MSLPAPPPPSASPSADDRGTEILARVRSAFARKGFDGTSMQDLAREAGISVGNFYRYFPSKTAIVEALVTQDLAETEGKFESVLEAPDRMAALRLGLALHVNSLERDDCRLWAEISAAAQRQSEVADTCRRMQDTVIASLLRIFADVTGLPPGDCEARFGAHARYIILLVKASAMSGDGSPDPEVNALMLRSIDKVLGEVADFSAKV